MRMIKNFALVMGYVFLGSSLSLAATESIELESYYPAPFGSYDMIRLVPAAADLAQPCDIGTLYVNSSNELQLCQGTQTWGPLTAGGGGAGLWTKEFNAVLNRDVVYLNDSDTDPLLLVGIGTKTPEFKLSLIQDGGIIAKGTIDTGEVLATTGAGTRMIWYPRKAAFRSGQVTGNQWDDVNIGKNSVATGYNAQAIGRFAVAMGREANAKGADSIALGYQTVSDERGGYGASIALGNGAQTSVVDSDGYNCGAGIAISAGGNTNAACGGTWAIGYNVSAGDPAIGSNLSNTGLGGCVTLGTNINGCGIGLLNANPPAGAKIGIGTATPEFQLTVQDAATLQGGILVLGGSGSSSGDPQFLLLDTPAAFRVGVTDAGAIGSTALGTANTGTSIYSFAAQGVANNTGLYGVGIGGSTATFYGTTLGTNYLITGSSGISFYSTRIGQGSSYSNYHNALAIGTSSKSWQTSGVALGQNSRCQLGNHSVAVALDGVDRALTATSVMEFTGGKVGIGTVSPGTTLSVLGLPQDSSGSTNFLKYTLNAAGDIYQAGSSKKHKKRIRPLKDDWFKVFNIVPQKYIDATNNKPGFGVVAEDIEAIGLKKLVLYDDKGHISGFQYEKLPLYMLMVMKDQEHRIRELKSAVCPGHPDAEVCQ